MDVANSGFGIEAVGGDSSGMSEADKPSQTTRSGGDGLSLNPRKASAYSGNQLPTKNSSFNKKYTKNRCRKRLVFYTCFNLWAYWTAPFSILLRRLCTFIINI